MAFRQQQHQWEQNLWLTSQSNTTSIDPELITRNSSSSLAQALLLTIQMQRQNFEPESSSILTETVLL